MVILWPSQPCLAGPSGAGSSCPQSNCQDESTVQAEERQFKLTRCTQDQEGLVHLCAQRLAPIGGRACEVLQEQAVLQFGASCKLARACRVYVSHGQSGDVYSCSGILRPIEACCRQSLATGSCFTCKLVSQHVDDLAVQ